MKNTKKILLAISGGPDSMFLLWKYRNKNIVVAHVNYNKRPESIEEQKLVANFCQKYKIPYFIKSIDSKEVVGNFQNWAREIRYEFFAQIYKQQQCNVLYTAHHKDDFLETALMQIKTNRKPLYYGIKKTTKFKNMNVYRPLLFKYWKNQITKKVNKRKIPYGIDKSNEEPIYFRNEIRLNLKESNNFQKNYQLLKIYLLNCLIVWKSKIIKQEYQKWEANYFDKKTFQKLKYQKEIVFHFVHTKTLNVKLGSKKINSIIDFINSNNSETFFILDSSYRIVKKQNKLFVEEIKS